MTPWYFPWKRRPKLSPSEREAIYKHRARLLDQRERARHHRRTVRDIDAELQAATNAQLRCELGMFP